MLVVGRNFKVLSTLFIITVIYSCYYFLPPILLNRPGVFEYFATKVFEQTGYKISFKKPVVKMGFVPSVWLKAEEFSVLNDDNSAALQVLNPNINVRLIPMIFENLDLRYFYADSLKADFVYTKDEKLKLGQYIIEKSENSFLKPVFFNINCGNFLINLNDELQAKKFSLNGKYLNFIKDKENITLRTDVIIYSGARKTYINGDISLAAGEISENYQDINVSINNLYLEDFSPYVKKISKDKIDYINGVVNVETNTVKTIDNKKLLKSKINVDDLCVFKKDLSASIYSKDKLEITSEINLIKNGIQINDFKVLSKGINIFLSGKITKFNSKIPHLDLKVDVDKSRAENIIALLPGEENLVPDINLLLLKQTGFWGDVNSSMEIKGKADLPQVYGSTLVSNAYMVKPIQNAEKAVIKLLYKGDKMDLDVKVPTSPTQIVYVRGPINLDKDRSADLNITSTENVDLKTAQIILNPLHRILHFDIGPVPVMDIKGKGGIKLHVTGTRKNPHGWGQFWFNNATVSFIDIKNMMLVNGSGTLDFDNQNTFFATKTASLYGKPVSVKGTCSLHGNLDFLVNSNGQQLQNILKIIKTSPMLIDIQKLTQTIENGTGEVNLNLNLTGQVKDVDDIVFNKNLFAKGNVKLLSNMIKLKGIPAVKASGNINFNNLTADFKLISFLNNSKINIEGKINDMTANLKVVSNKFNLGDGLKVLPKNIKIPYVSNIASINSSFVAVYNGDIENINYDKLRVKGKIYSNKGAKSPLILENTSFELNNSNLKMPLLKGSFKGSPFTISADIENVVSDKRIVNGYFQINSFDLKYLDDKNIQDIFSFNDVKFLNGKINISARAKNNTYTAFIVPEDINLIYKPKNLKFYMNGGNILLRNNVLNLNKVSARLSEMPVFVNGNITNPNSNPYLNLYVNAKPTQEFIEQFFNNKAVYPIKLKGDVNLTSQFRGYLNNLNMNSTLNLAENSGLYFMGASIGDVENPVKISVNANVNENLIRIYNLRYDKIISSQNNKPFVKPQLNASGKVYLLSNNNVGFDNFRIKTEAPTDAKIFNIIFRKPLMKQGVFNSDLVLNGTSLKPKLKGSLEITSIDIPFFDSTIRDINLDFANGKINIKSRGTILTNDVHISAVMKNNLVSPFVLDNLNIKLADLNINKIIDTYRDFEVEASRTPSYSVLQPVLFDMSQLIINKATIAADKIQVRNINADNFNADLSINDKMQVNIPDFHFNIAEGNVNGSLKYNLLNHKSNLIVHLDKANALIMSEALFDLKGQIYGFVNGDFNLSCNGRSNETCFKTLSGEGTFKVANGRMPKLGSLEYLLKAGNLIKGGLVGLSINSIIDLITPLKTGEFESISGDVHINDGIADNINIYSSGHDLNMYMTGSYNIVNSVADMDIYGSLSKNITTVFGKIKNASLNTLFNTIPGINNSTDTLIMQTEIGKIPNIKEVTDIYRIFTVEINGDINGDNYVRSFKWVK